MCLPSRRHLVPCDVFFRCLSFPQFPLCSRMISYYIVTFNSVLAFKGSRMMRHGVAKCQKTKQCSAHKRIMILQWSSKWMYCPARSRVIMNWHQSGWVHELRAYFGFFKFARSCESILRFYSYNGATNYLKCKTGGLQGDPPFLLYHYGLQD